MNVCVQNYIEIGRDIAIYLFFQDGGHGTGGTCPPFMVMSPNILEVMSFRMSNRVTATVVCCILMQILCVVSQKSFSFWGTLNFRK